MDNAVRFEYRDILKQPLSKEELNDLATKGGLTVAGLLNPKSSGFKKMNKDYKSISDHEAAMLIYENQKIMRRPLLTDGNKLVVGFDAEQYAALTS